MKLFHKLTFLAGFIILIALGLNLAEPLPTAAQGFSCSTVSQIPQIECDALVAFYNATDGENWVNNSGWLTTNTPCSWFSITCASGNVVILNPANNGLNGTIPAEIGNFTYLQYLILHLNDLSGPIPPEIGNLTNLKTLGLHLNQLTGSIPPELGNLTSLEWLDLYDNQLTGSLPSELGNLASLRVIQIDDNQLTGSIPFELGGLSNLENLQLGDNQFSGDIPSEIGNLTSLELFRAYGNQLTGNIPPELGNLTNLEVLNLSSNLLVGPVPSELGNLLNLDLLHISLNQGLVGPLPQTLTNLSLSYLSYHSTSVCEPANSAFQQWLASIPNLNNTGIAVCYTPLNVPLFLQTDPTWSNDLYGSYQTQPNNIGKWGCYMTSAAMVINYYAELEQSSFRTNPGLFNTWLRNNNLYDENNFYHHSAQAYADENGVSLFIPSPGRIDGPRDADSDDKLNISLSEGDPAILRVNAPGSASGQHFVVAVGTTTINNVPTYVINDPIYGQTTLYERYNNQYTSIRLFTSEPSEQRSLTISAHSPVEIVITDPLGRKTGFDPTTGISWNDIPDASYTIDAIAPDGGQGPEDPEKVKTIFIYGAIDGQYTVEIFGVDQGSYTINAFATNIQGNITSETFQGEATNGSSEIMRLNYDSETGLQNYFLYLPMLIKN